MTKTAYRSRLAIEEGRIYWREVGQGPALVLLHGGWGDGRQWQPLVEELSRSYRCFIPDLPGFGDSTLWADQPLAVTTLVDAIAHYLQALNLKRVSLVGYGIGGWVAAGYALRFPYAVHRLLLVEPEGVSSPDQAWLSRWGKRLSVQTSFWAGLFETIAPLGELPGPTQRIKTLLNLRKQIMSCPISGTLLYARDLKAIQQDLLDRELPRLLVPALILERENASPRTKILAERFAALCHEAVVALLPESSDRAQADLLVRQIHSFIESETVYRDPVMTTKRSTQPVAPKPLAPRTRALQQVLSAAPALLRAVPQLPQS